MPDHPVTYIVPQGSIHTALPTENIGTDGCATCVGIIVVDNSNFKVCGHIDSAIMDDGDMASVLAQATRILATRFPTAANTVRVGYCTSSNGNTTTAIINAITNRYGGLVTLASRNRDGIRARDNGNLFHLGFADNLVDRAAVHGVSAENDLARIR